MTKVYNFHAANDVKIPYKRNVDGSIIEDDYKIDSMTLETCCSSCVILAICKNKHPSKLIFCPLLDPYFLKMLHDLPNFPPNDAYAYADTIAYGIIVRLTPLNITVWLKRESIFIGFVDIIRNRAVHHVSRRFDL